MGKIQKIYAHLQTQANKAYFEYITKTFVPLWDTMQNIEKLVQNDLDYRIERLETKTYLISNIAAGVAWIIFEKGTYIHIRKIHNTSDYRKKEFPEKLNLEYYQDIRYGEKRPIRGDYYTPLFLGDSRDPSFVMSLLLGLDYSYAEHIFLQNGLGSSCIALLIQIEQMFEWLDNPDFENEEYLTINPI